MDAGVDTPSAVPHPSGRPLRVGDRVAASHAAAAAADYRLAVAGFSADGSVLVAQPGALGDPAAHAPAALTPVAAGYWVIAAAARRRGLLRRR